MLKSTSFVYILDYSYKFKRLEKLYLNYSIGGPMPMFQDEICPFGLVATKCIQVTFSNGIIDFLMLTRLTNESSIYEGYLAKEKDVGVVMIETPHENYLVGDFSL